jgi:hypothetical protein
VLVLLTVLFDLFWLPQRHAAPDIAAASAFLRLAVLTPGTVLFCLLDRRGRLGRLYEAALLALAVAPSVITAYLCLATKEMLSQPEIYGTPLILLYTGVLLRLRLGAVVANTAICTLVYAYSIAICPMLPHDEVGTVIFIQLVIDAAMIMFNLQLETRDRRVFLLTQNERIRRSLVAEQNRGLLRETQTDSLTRLANRRCFDQTLSARWLEAAETHEAIALIMIDVDHFKTFKPAHARLYRPLWRGRVRRHPGGARRGGGGNGRRATARWRRATRLAASGRRRRCAGDGQPGRGHRLARHRARRTRTARGCRPEPLRGEAQRPQPRIDRRACRPTAPRHPGLKPPRHR